MGGCDQSQVKIKFKKFEKVKSVPKTYHKVITMTLLQLPPPWQSCAVLRVWKGQFLALLHGRLSEPVILELDVNRNL